MIPRIFREGILVPIFKKPNVDPSISKHYKPVIMSHIIFSEIFELSFLESSTGVNNYPVRIRGHINMQLFLERLIGECLNAHSVACYRGAWLVFRNRLAPNKRHCQLVNDCGFLPNPFIQDLFLWRTSQEFVKTDLYPLSSSIISTVSGKPSDLPGAGQ